MQLATLILMSICTGRVELLINRIIGGDIAAPLQIPYQVSVQLSAYSFHFCAGVVIADRYVLSAAHCYPFFDPEDLQIWAGGRDLTDRESGLAVDVDAIFVRNYTEETGRENDLAVLKLKTPLELSRSVGKIGLDEKGVAAGDSCVVSGWGVTEDSSADSYSPILRYATVFVADSEQCRRAYADLDLPVNVTDTMICAGHPAGGRDSCRGDSGGPLVCDGRLAGIVSFGASCGQRDYPGVYTAVAPHLAWINSVTSPATTPQLQKIAMLLFLITYL